MHERQKPDEQNWYVSAYQDKNGTPSLKISRLKDGAYFHLKYCDGTQFVVDHQGTQIWATWSSELTLEDTATYLLGPVLGFVLRLRGITCLHASAIAVGGLAIALVGPAGVGKSTTAAAFARQGYPVLAEDIVALIDTQRYLSVQPGYPQVRLWPDSVKALYNSDNALPRLTPTWDKRYLDLTAPGYRFQQQPLPLAAVYMLGERSYDPIAPCIGKLPPRAALMGLIVNTYVNYLLDKAMRAQDFHLLARLVSHVPVTQVTPSAHPMKLLALCSTILDDFNTLTKHSNDRDRSAAS
jgi:hypothetical protein